MDDILLRLIGCLLQVLGDHGTAAYRRAGRRALVAVCTVLIEEAEGGKPPRPKGKVVRLPLRTAGRNDTDD